MSENNEIETDVLVVGGGISGISAAVEAYDRGARVVLVTKGAFGRDGASTWMASIGYNAALYPPDDREVHVRDIIVAGKYLGNQKLITTLVNLFPTTVKELTKWGIRWEKDASGRFIQTGMPCSTYWRSLKPTKGRPAFRRALVQQVRQRNIRVLEDVFITDLLTVDNAAVGVLGIYLVSGEFFTIRSKATILATGGAANCFKFSSNGSATTGDGMAMAYRAGARLMDMEFHQFIPAMGLWPPSIRGGDTYKYMLNVYGHLYNNQGERFMERYCPLTKEWSSRQEVSRSIASEIRERRNSPHGGVYLGLNHLPRNILSNFLEYMKNDGMSRKLQNAGIDLYHDAFEVGSPAHYTQGGCCVNEKCESSIDGLYIIGETASGVDGADRAGGNALPFCMAFGMVGGKEASLRASAVKMPQVNKEQVKKLRETTYQSLLTKEHPVSPSAIREKIQSSLEEYAQFARNATDLNKAIQIICDIRENEFLEMSLSVKSLRFNMEWIEALETRNMLDVAEMTFRSALMRTESRGAHERSDFPIEDSQWLKNIIVQKTNEDMMLAAEPVKFIYYDYEAKNG